MHILGALWIGGVFAVLALVCSGPAAAADRAAPPFSGADYWVLADRIMTGLDGGWDPALRAYDGTVRANSGLLLTHAIAALRGHKGPTRMDGRARVLVHRLTSTPVWLGAGPLTRGGRSTCWSLAMDEALPQHASLEAKVAEALAWAWRARRELRLTPAATRRIVRRLTACGAPRSRSLAVRIEPTG